ncbi:ADP-ribosylation factor-like protein 4A-like [Arapaima gigas]
MGNGVSDQNSLFPNLPCLHSLHIAILGLDSAGKTTVLYRLQFGEFVNTVPTKGFNAEKVKVSLCGSRAVTFHFWDVGGQEKLRPLWKSYTRCTDGIVFVVDSVDAERMEEAKTELHKITRLSENQGVPVLVVANKQDLRNSLTVEQIKDMLALHELGPSPWHLQPTCAIIGEGLLEGLARLHDMILKRKKMLRQQKKRPLHPHLTRTGDAPLGAGGALLENNQKHKQLQHRSSEKSTDNNILLFYHLKIRRAGLQ